MDMGLGSVVPFLDNDAASTWARTGGGGQSPGITEGSKKCH